MVGGVVGNLETRRHEEQGITFKEEEEVEGVSWGRKRAF
jgi:hypothetical protein